MPLDPSHEDEIPPVPKNTPLPDTGRELDLPTVAQANLTEEFDFPSDDMSDDDNEHDGFKGDGYGFGKSQIYDDVQPTGEFDSRTKHPAWCG